MKIPKHAKKVFEGVIFDVYQWEQEMYDGSVQRYERIKRANTVTVIPTMGDAILLAEEEQPMVGKFLSLFGGRQEPNEEPIAGAKRELLEESGLASESWELLFTNDVSDKIEWDVYTYIAYDCIQAGKPHLDPGEKVTVRAVTFDELLDLVEKPGFRSIHLTNHLQKIRHDKKMLDAFKKKLFPKL